MPKRKLYRCKYCNHETTERVDKWRHIKTHVLPEKLLTCNSCPFVTEYKHHLEYHRRNHSGFKPFKCEQCDYQCVNRSMLKSHSKSHSTICPYQCGQCQYATKYSHSLKMHLKKYCHQTPDGSPEVTTNRTAEATQAAVSSPAQPGMCKVEVVKHEPMVFQDNHHDHDHHQHNHQTHHDHHNNKTHCCGDKHGGSTGTSPAPTITSTNASTPISSTTPTSMGPHSVTSPSFSELEPQMDILDLRINSKLRIQTN